MRRLPILYLICAVLIVVSVGPLLIYGIKMIGINREALETNEKELQNTITRSVAAELGLHDSSVSEQLRTLSRTVLSENGEVAAWDAHVSTTLEQFVSSNPDLLLYVSLLNQQARGIAAGQYQAVADPFLRKALERAFTAAQQFQPYQSEPVLVLRQSRQVPVMVVSLPLTAGGRFQGMLAAVVNLEPMVKRLQEYSIRGLETFVVDGAGRLMLHPDLSANTIGQDFADLPIVRRFRESWGGGQAQARETSSYDIVVGKRNIPMLGTYCSVPGLRWAVIAQKPQSVAYLSVYEMQRVTTLWGVVLILIALAVAYASALRITTPIQVLTDSSRAIARGDFSRRIQLQSRTEIGELAATFNQMTSELERYVAQLKQAAEENQELFLSSIQMIAAAVDEKDPYTRGHSERVTGYSMLIASEMGLSDEEMYKVKIAGLLHDVGKIGIEDRVLKKPGALTPEEFQVMKTHTTRGATILRPIEKLREIIPGVELHHESLDGRGYPHGLRDDAIPLLPRIISVADTFDAMTTDRPYQAAMEPDVALRYIQSQVDRKYDGRCAEALQRAFASGKLHQVRGFPAAAAQPAT
jgi:putative nucleotidyltransferase with HDIG domain